MKTKTTKDTYRLVTDHFEVQLITETTPISEPMGGVVVPLIDAPVVYLMIGPVGGPLARIENQDAEILSTLLARILQSGHRYLPATAPGLGAYSRMP